MAKKKVKRSFFDSPSGPQYSGTTNEYEVESRFEPHETVLITAVEAIPFVGRGISDLFFGNTKRNEKLDQVAAQKVSARRHELDRISPRAAYDLGTAFYDNAFARERSEIKGVK